MPTKPHSRIIIWRYVLQEKTRPVYVRLWKMREIRHFCSTEMRQLAQLQRE